MYWLQVSPNRVDELINVAHTCSQKGAGEKGKQDIQWMNNEHRDCLNEVNITISRTLSSRVDS